MSDEMNQSPEKDAPDNAAFIHGRLDDLELSHREFRLYGHMARRCGRDGFYFESTPKAAAHIRVNVKTIPKIIKRLEELGLIALVSAPPGSYKTYRTTKISEWPPHPMEYPTQSDTGVSKRVGTPPNRGRGGRVSKRVGTPPTGIPPKYIPLSPSPEVNPKKGESNAPSLANVEGWKLRKDLKAVKDLIREERESCKPNPGVIAGMRAEQNQINAELERRGKAAFASGSAIAPPAGPSSWRPGSSNL